MSHLGRAGMGGILQTELALHPHLPCNISRDEPSWGRGFLEGNVSSLMGFHLAPFLRCLNVINSCCSSLIQRFLVCSEDTDICYNTQGGKKESNLFVILNLSPTVAAFVATIAAVSLHATLVFPEQVPPLEIAERI